MVDKENADTRFFNVIKASFQLPVASVEDNNIMKGRRLCPRLVRNVNIHPVTLFVPQWFQSPSIGTGWPPSQNENEMRNTET